MTTRLPASVAVMLCLLAPGSAWAQFNQYWLPVEQGKLDSHVDLQLQYSRLSVAGEDLNVVILGVEAQYAIKDRFEVGLNVPALVKSYAAGVAFGESDAAFGNIMLNLKARLFSIGEVLSLAAYTNVMLPTHSEVDSRKYTMIVPGVAATGKLLGVLVGGGLGLVWFAVGNDAPDTALITVDVYGGYSLFGILTFKLALQYANSFKPDSDTWALGITPGLEVDLLDIVRVGAAVRIATNDEALALYGGRAALLFHGGISF